jgi:hypothetical protein
MRLWRSQPGLIRQGDVLLVPVTAVPGEGRQEVDRQQGRLVLQEGEATGHAHVVRDECAQLVTAGQARVLYLLVNGAVPASLEHEEHATLLVPPGVYAVRRQREWSDDDRWRWVCD